MTTEMLNGLIGKYSAAITCFCFMGGDADPSEIQRLSHWIKKEYPHLKTAWYSGRTELPSDFDKSSMNYVKIGPYIETLGGLKSPATNQKLYKILKDGTLEAIPYCKF